MAGILKWIGRGVDELMKLGYPESVARRINSGELPMDEASRKAREDAFGIDAFHASQQDIPEFKAGYDDEMIFTTPNVEFANNWLGKGKLRGRIGEPDSFDLMRAEQNALLAQHPEWRKALDDADYSNISALEANPDYQAYEKAMQNLRSQYRQAYNTIYPVKVKANSTFDPSNPDHLKPFLEFYAGKSGMKASDLNPQIVDMVKNGNYMIYENADTTKWLRDNGFDSLRVAESSDGVLDTLVTMDPSNIRSKYAAFDPEYTGSNILGSRVAPTVTTGVLGALILEEQRKKKEQAKSQVGGILGQLQSGKEMY